MRNFKDIIIEKLKVSKEYKEEIDFSWYELVKLIYKNDCSVHLLDICENNDPIFKDFHDLPEFTPNTSKPKYMYSTPGGFIIGLRVDYINYRNGWIDIMYRLEENGSTQYCTTEAFSDLKDFLDTELIIKIYDYLKQNA